MNMKCVFAAVCLTCVASVCAEDLQYLYWQVDLESSNPNEVADFSYATVSDNNGVSYLSFYSTEGEAVGTKMAADDWQKLGDVGKTAGPLYSGFAASASSGTYLFELWQEDSAGNASRVGWATYGYAQLADFIYKTMAEGAGATPLTVAAVPEPTGALLLLIGISGLALRRRKALMALLLAVTLQLGAFADANNLLYTVLRDGFDTYADGARALDGEYYALVFLPTGSTGVEFAADCTVVDTSKGRIVKVVKSTENGEPFCFQVDSSVVSPLKGMGSWAVYLLDTRSYGASGVATVAAAGANGLPTCVNASKKLEDAVLTVSASSGPVRQTAAGAVADAGTAVPADTPNPQITGIEIVDGEVRVKVAQTVPYIQYNLSAGETLGGIEGRKAKAPRNGVVGDEIELVVPAEGSSGFFKVNRN